jgi:hypothetical protein
MQRAVLDLELCPFQAASPLDVTTRGSGCENGLSAHRLRRCKPIRIRPASPPAQSSVTPAQWLAHIPSADVLQSEKTPDRTGARGRIPATITGAHQSVAGPVTGFRASLYEPIERIGSSNMKCLNSKQIKGIVHVSIVHCDSSCSATRCHRW